ncbi:MAG: type II toxin-antitoxin system RelE/ParE family toxin [Acidobacteria bacterium]|nr:type II toxin-antitoxin system RelE/ParE family toxin [Acidobacteriota bacterium]
MQLRWTEEAADDLEHIAGYLLTHTPSRAPDLVRAVYDAPSDLLTFPNRGRQGKKEGTRELVLAPLPYLVVYKVLGDVIFVVRILHGAQKWP